MKSILFIDCIFISSCSDLKKWNPSTRKKTQKLSSKTLAILELAREGKTEKEISILLNISLATVKYYKQRIFHQLGVCNIAEAINWITSQKKFIKK